MQANTLQQVLNALQLQSVSVLKAQADTLQGQFNALQASFDQLRFLKAEITVLAAAALDNVTGVSAEATASITSLVESARNDLATSVAQASALVQR